MCRCIIYALSVYVCMYIHVCVFACLYVCMYESMLCVCLYVWVYRVCAYIYVCIYASCVCVCADNLRIHIEITISVLFTLVMFIGRFLVVFKWASAA